MSTNVKAELDTVYKTVQRQGSGSLNPSVTIEGAGASVNVYVGISEKPWAAAPADKTEMVLDEVSPLSVGVHTVRGQADYLLFETVTGTPVIKTKNLLTK